MPHYDYSGYNTTSSGGFATSLEITAFESSITLAELGTTINSILLSWSYRGTPDAQEIDQGIGALPVHTRSYTYTQPIASNTEFTLTASDSLGNLLTKKTDIEFIHPVFVGAVNGINPSAAEILSMNKMVVNTTFDYDFIIADQRTAIAIPQSFSPLTEIRQAMLGLNLMQAFTITQNVNVNGIPYRVYVMTQNQDTDGLIQSLQFVWG